MYWYGINLVIRSIKETMVGSGPNMIADTVEPKIMVWNDTADTIKNNIREPRALEKRKLSSLLKRKQDGRTIKTTIRVKSSASHTETVHECEMMHKSKTGK